MTTSRRHGKCLNNVSLVSPVSTRSCRAGNPQLGLHLDVVKGGSVLQVY